MEFFLKVGVVVGACLGLVHAGYVSQQVANGARSGSTPRSIAPYLRGAYYAIWTLGLWLIFGAYVFTLWVIGVVIYAIVKAVQGLRSARV